MALIGAVERFFWTFSADVMDNIKPITHCIHKINILIARIVSKYFISRFWGHRNLPNTNSFCITLLTGPKAPESVIITLIHV